MAQIVLIIGFGVLDIIVDYLLILVLYLTQSPKLNKDYDWIGCYI